MNSKSQHDKKIPEKLVSDGEGGGGFSGAGRTIEEHVGATTGFEGVGENSNYFFLVSNVFHLLWATDTKLERNQISEKQKLG